MTSPRDTYTLLAAFVDELARCGMSHACTSPGSRSTPLVASLVRDGRLRCWSHLDERCAGFFALGLAKATDTPVAIACTSGTAAANLYPAVIEAFQARVPLVVLTADRPPEMREVGAGQTIDQVKLYGDAVKWFFEVGTHEATAERTRWIRSLACRAYWTALEGRPGPVHLNWPLREPLVLDEPLSAGDTGRTEGRPWLARPPVRAAPLDPVLEALADLLGANPRGVVVAGRHERGDDLPVAVSELARTAGYPILADPLSGARRAGAIAHYDALLRDGAFAADHRPDLVLRVGDLPTSKPLRTWLASLGTTPQVALDAEGAWHDPAAVVGGLIASDPALTLSALAQRVDRPADRGWRDAWLAADERARSAISAALEGELSEPLVALELGRRLPADAIVFAGSSMPIRDLESFWPARDDAPLVLANRGANGIDGSVSTPFGVAAGATGPVVGLIGDVALAHDIGGLVAARRLGLSVTFVVLNNEGGGIFDFLPVAAERDIFEEHVATPPGLDVATVAALYGLRHELVGDARALADALNRDRGGGSSILEVRTDRAANVAVHERVWDAVAQALQAPRAEVSPPAPAAAPRA